MRTTLSLNFDPPHYLEELPSPSKTWLHTSWGMNFPAQKITLSCTFREHRAAQPYQNGSLQLSHARIVGTHAYMYVTDTWTYVLTDNLHTYMYTYRHMSIKQREAHVYTTYRAGKGSTKAQSPTAVRAEAVQVYTDVFSPTYHKNINT